MMSWKIAIKELTSKYEWNPYKSHGTFSKITSDSSNSITSILDLYNYTDSISAELTFSALNVVMTRGAIWEFNENQCNNESSNKISAIQSNKHSTLTPESLSKMWGIGLRTAKRTLKSTTHQCIRTTGLLSKRFKTDRSQLRYKQLSRRYGPFYVDYLKVGVKSLRSYIGGTLYTNKLGFKKFFPCSTETSQETGSTLRNLIEIIGPPLHFIPTIIEISKTACLNVS